VDKNDADGAGYAISSWEAFVRMKADAPGQYGVRRRPPRYRSRLPSGLSALQWSRDGARVSRAVLPLPAPSYEEVDAVRLPPESDQHVYAEQDRLCTSSGSIIGASGGASDPIEKAGNRPFCTTWAAGTGFSPRRAKSEIVWSIRAPAVREICIAASKTSSSTVMVVGMGRWRWVRVWRCRPVRSGSTPLGEIWVSYDQNKEKCR
jgi:hypothetical protein